MSDCYPSSQCQTKTQPNKHQCPSSGQYCSEVSLNTILKHIKTPWNLNLIEQEYYYCDDPDCDTVYFGKDNFVITQPELRTKVGIKNKSEDATLCYCFGVSRRDYKLDPNIKSFVITQTKNNVCSCNALNPSGKCCLKEF